MNGMVVISAGQPLAARVNLQPAWAIDLSDPFKNTQIFEARIKMVPWNSESEFTLLSV